MGRNAGFKNGRVYYGYKLPLGNYDKDKGGPLFLSNILSRVLIHGIERLIG